jgi:hypothetical protein
MAFLKIPKDVEELYLDKIRQFLERGKTVTTVVKSNRRKVKYINTGIQDHLIDYHPLEKDVDYSEKTTIQHLPTPDHVLELVGNSLSEDAAIEYLTNKGYLVIDPTIVKEKEGVNKGISEETVQEIRRQLLGIE